MIFYTGSYTEKDGPAARPAGKGIGCFEFDDETGAIKLLGYTPQRNPSYLAISPDKKYLYACEEIFEHQAPTICAYKIEEDGKLSLFSRQALKGDFACHLGLVSGQLVAANYFTANILSFPLSEEGGLAPHEQVIQHKGTGPNSERQEAAHAHMVYPFGDNCMYIVDLGIDTAKAYHLDPASGQWQAIPDKDLKVEPGAGARHMLLSGDENTAYVLGELSSEVFVLKRSEPGFRQVQKLSCLPDNFNGDHGSAALRMHPNKEFLYASVRGANLIAIFRIDRESGLLTKVALQAAAGLTPRDFNIHPNGKWLLVANQDSNQVVVFKIDTIGGQLTQHSVFEVDTPVNICWLA